MFVDEIGVAKAEDFSFLVSEVRASIGTDMTTPDRRGLGESLGGTSRAMQANDGGVNVRRESCRAIPSREVGALI